MNTIGSYKIRPVDRIRLTKSGRSKFQQSDQSYWVRKFRFDNILFHKVVSLMVWGLRSENWLQLKEIRMYRTGRIDIVKSDICLRYIRKKVEISKSFLHILKIFVFYMIKMVYECIILHAASLFSISTSNSSFVVVTSWVHFFIL